MKAPREIIDHLSPPDALSIRKTLAARDEGLAAHKNWAPDATGIVADAVVEAWKAGSPSQADVKAVRAFIEEKLYGWGDELV